MKTLIIAQARMGSTRVPGKVMRNLEGMPVLHWVFKACDTAEGADGVIIATSTLEADNVIAEYCFANWIPCFRGSEWDVVDRFYQCALEHKADILLRVTCDCPFLDPRVISEVIKLREMTGAAYASNIHPATYPDGLDVECFTFDALAETHREATRPTDRDCVTQYIVRNRHKFPARNLTCPLPGLDKERWVLDTEEDWNFCKELAVSAKSPGQSYVKLRSILDANPHLRNINNADRGAGRNERFYDALSAEATPPRQFHTSARLFEQASSIIPFGAQTFSKSYLQYPKDKAPLLVSHADGARIYDVDGNDYIDLVSALLPVILGYRDQDVDRAIRDQLDSGISLSLATELEYKLSKKLCDLIPCAEMVKFGKNGTDVTSAAVRLARAYTKRNHIIICGGYHGWADWALQYTERMAGVPQSFDITRRPFGSDLSIFESRSIAAVIVEPNSDPDYLQSLREFCTKYGIVLIFDEVITGFRYSLGGAQKLWGVTPDLACFGKAMANGMPLSALVGKREIMRKCAPPDNIFYSGTFFGETLSLAASLATIGKMERENVIAHITATGVELDREIHLSIRRNGIDDFVKVGGYYPRTTLSFTDDRVKTMFMEEMIQCGILITNSNNLTFAHRKSELQRIVAAYTTTFEKIAAAIRTKNLDQLVPEPTKTAPLRAVT